MGQKTKPEKQQTLSDHLKELKRRFLLCFALFVLFGVLTYFFYQPIIAILSKTLSADLYYSDPAGGFSFVMRICTVGAMILSMPILIYNLIKFISPALKSYVKEGQIIVISLFSMLFALAGSVFAVIVVLPESVNFFREFSVSGLSALIDADKYLSFVVNMIAVFALSFQVPMIMLFIDSIKNIPPSTMIKTEKWIVVISIVVAIITPFNYDLFSSMIIALPIIGLYNLSLIMIGFKRLVNHPAKSEKAMAAAGDMNEIISQDQIQMNDSLLEIFVDDYAHPDDFNPEPSSAQPKMSCMDIVKKKNNTCGNNVRPAAWYIEKQRKIAKLNREVKVFSDVRPASHGQRRLVSF